MVIYDVLHKINSNTYAGLYSKHSIDEEGWIDGYEIISKSPIVYIFQFGDSIGYVNGEFNGKFYLDIENCGYELETLQEGFDLLYNYFGG